MKKVLFIVIAAAIGIGIVMLMQSNKMPANGQSSTIAPITEDTMTPATSVPAEVPASPESNSMDNTAPSSPDTSSAPASDNSMPMDQAPATAPANDMQGTAQQQMDNTTSAVQQREDAAMQNGAANPGAPIDNVNESTK